jgi:hypothetical protein
MALFTNLIPYYGQTSVPRTSIVGFTILTDGYDGAKISTLSAIIGNNQAILNGNFVNGYSGNIYSSVGKYVVGIHPKTPFLPSASKIDISLQILDDYSSMDAYNYSFYTSGYNAPVITIPISDAYVTGRVCDGSAPEFPPTERGLVAALDAGTGTEVNLHWNAGAPANENNIVYYNVYHSTDVNLIFKEEPKFLVADTKTTIGGLCPGYMNFFGVRIAEFNPSLINTDGMQMVGPNMYRYPSSTLLSNITAVSPLIPANTENFPEDGVIKFDGELVRYTSLSSSGFVVGSRGFAGTIAASHTAGQAIVVYRGREDRNTTVVLATPTFQKPNYAINWVKGDGYGDDGYRDGYDGCALGTVDAYGNYDGYYKLRQEKYDSITTDGTNNDSLGEFDRMDYCGSWRALSPASFMKGQCRNSYWGGIQVRNGVRVKESNVMTHMLQREELLLETDGEPFVLIRRMWTGIRCFCSMQRREHASSRCPNCFGTSFVQGYVQFFNPRRQDRRILIRVDPATDDLNIVDRGGLEPMYEPSAWTIAFPQIKDRDMLVRFNTNGTEEWRYEILSVERVRAFFAQSGAQKFRMKRFPKTDTIYQFPILRNASPQPGAVSTSVNSGAGLKAHSHQVIIPNGMNLNKFRTATLISEGHNHIIMDGVIQNVLGHTHTL